MKMTDMIAMLTKTIPAHDPVLITGMPGAGKTEGVEHATELCKCDMILSHPVVSDPTDAKGLPAKISDTEAAFLPFGDLLKAMQVKRDTVWFLDDLGQATASVQASFMQLILKREINGKRISDHITFVAATNRRVDKAGVSGILEPVKSRFLTIVELKPDLDSWCQWAIAKGLPATLIAFLRLRSDLLAQFNPTADMSNSPLPRTWYNLSKIERYGLPQHVEHEMMCGAVGEGAAVEYLAFRKMASALESIDVILTNPGTAKLPKTPAEGYAIATGLAMRTNAQNLKRVTTYALRMADNGQGDFAALIVRDSLRRTPALANTTDYVTLMSGPIGQLISGQAITTRA